MQLYDTEVVQSYGGHPALLVVDVQNDKQNAIVGGISMKVKQVVQCIDGEVGKLDRLN